MRQIIKIIPYHLIKWLNDSSIPPLSTVCRCSCAGVAFACNHTNSFNTNSNRFNIQCLYTLYGADESLGVEGDSKWWRRWPRFRVNYLLTSIQSVRDCPSKFDIINNSISSNANAVSGDFVSFRSVVYLHVAPACHTKQLENEKFNFISTTTTTTTMATMATMSTNLLYTQTIFTEFSLSWPSTGNIVSGVCRRHLVHSWSHMQCGIISWLFLLPQIFISRSFARSFSFRQHFSSPKRCWVATRHCWRWDRKKFMY